MKWYNICENAVQATYKVPHISIYFVNITTSGHSIPTVAGEGTGWMDHEIKFLKYLESKGESNKEIKHHKVICAEMKL